MIELLLFAYLAFVMGAAIAQTPSGRAVSFSAQIAPILALHCNSCHGDQEAAGGLDTRTWRSLMNSGVVAPSDPGGSLLLELIEGRRGPEHRMPLRSRSLESNEIDLIRRWIAQGARDDPDTTLKHRLTLADIRVERSQHLRINCKVPVESYLVLTLIDPKRNRVIHREAAAVQMSPDRPDIKTPGQWVRWEISPARDWPKRLRIEVAIDYAATWPAGALLQLCDEIGRVRVSAELEPER